VFSTSLSRICVEKYVEIFENSIKLKLFTIVEKEIGKKNQ
jgi:hypothetical protein